MFALVKSLVLLTVGLSLTNAIPTNYPEVIPGPGLPSLKDLGLTSKDLYTMKSNLTNTNHGSVNKRANGVCLPFTTGSVENTIACFNYLVSIGTKTCSVPSSGSIFCTAGDAAIIGQDGLSEGKTTSSSCENVALAVQWIFTNCNVGGRVGGSDEVDANTSLNVYAVNINQASN